MVQLDGKVAIVTGSGRGIGQQVALRLARDGAAVKGVTVLRIGAIEDADIVMIDVI